MTVIHEAWRRGVRHTSAYTSVVAAATSTAVHALPTGRTGMIRKMHILNRNGATSTVTFGTFVAGVWTQVMPGIPLPTGTDFWLDEEQIPNVEFTSSIYAQASAAAAAPLDVQIQVEVEEFQGVTG